MTEQYPGSWGHEEADTAPPQSIDQGNPLDTVVTPPADAYDPNEPVTKMAQGFSLEVWHGSFEDFYQDFYGPIINKITRTDSYAAGNYEHDIAQEVMLIAWKNGWHESGYSAFHIANLVRMTARNLAITRWRQRRRVDTVFAPEELVEQSKVGTGPSVTPRFENVIDIFETLRQYLAEHPAQVHQDGVEMVLLKAYNYTEAEIAQKYGIPKSTVRSRLFAARLSLREHFADK